MTIVSASERDLGEDSMNLMGEDSMNLIVEAMWIHETDRKNNNNKRSEGDREEADGKILEKYEHLTNKQTNKNQRHPEKAWAEK